MKLLLLDTVVDMFRSCLEIQTKLKMVIKLSSHYPYTRAYRKLETFVLRHFFDVADFNQTLRKFVLVF